MDGENCPSIAESARRMRILELDETLLSSSSSDDGEIDYEEAMYNEGNPKLVYLTGKAIRSEVNLKSLSASDRSLFDESMRKEWGILEQVPGSQGAHRRGDQDAATRH